MTEENKKPAADAKPAVRKVIKKKIIVKKIHHAPPPAPPMAAPPARPAPAPSYPQAPFVPRPAPSDPRRTPVVSLPKMPPRAPGAGGAGDGRKPPQGGGPRPGSPRPGGRKHSYEERKHKFRDDPDFPLQYHKKHEEQRILPKEITVLESITVGELARKLNIKVAELIKKLMTLGVLATITDVVDSDTATIVCEEYGVKVKVASLYEETLVKEEDSFGPDETPRDPVVTVMGHVDHGKTHLLDTIRTANVRSGESGLITQHIGAYKVRVKHNGTERGIVFLDTPGHEAFTSMRARGAGITDIVILVVAADDGVMPQTVEALNHAKAAKVPVIVAINKIDLPDKNLDRVKKDLSQHGLIPEEWGGENIFIEVSAKEKINIDKLLDSVLLVYDMHEKKANPARPALGSVIESHIDPGFGPSSTVLIQNGTLRTGDFFVAGIFTGKVKMMHDENGGKVSEAGPSTPVVVYGMDGIPDAGDPFQVVKSDKYAHQISDKRKELRKFEENKNVKKVTLSNFMDKISEGDLKELTLIIKADVKGSIEALEYSFNKLTEQNTKVRIKIVHSGTGPINKNDVILAAASNAVIVGFHVRPDNLALDLSSKSHVEIRTYEIIYDAIDDVKKAMEGLLDLQIREEVLGRAEVRNIFKVSKVGNIAGCFVVDGKMQRNAKARVIRDGIVVYTTSLSSLKRFKDDAKEVTMGMECGLTLDNYNDIKAGDIIEAFVEKKEAQKLFG
jgi:translation initiation factor IF-2